MTRDPVEKGIKTMEGNNSCSKAKNSENYNRYSKWESGEGYNRYITEELKSFRKEAWKRQILGHFGENHDIQVLDIGTGPGFFPCILSEEGMHVTGIDQSEGMLEKAWENAARLNVSPILLKIDVNRLEFPDSTFDLVLSRNVTWTLQYPEQVYAQLKRVMKPGGTMLIYDANWHAHIYDPELMKKVQAREEAYFQKYGRREVVANESMELLNTCPLTRIRRPEWDRKVLEDLGMKVVIEEDVGRFLYEEWEKDLYAESPLFEICAVKPAET